MTHLTETSRTASSMADFSLVGRASCRGGLAWLAGILLLTTGCGEKAEPITFDDISRLPASEELMEIKIGYFQVPIPLILDDSEENFEVDNRVQINFELVVIIDPKEQALVERLKERHRGKIRDEVMRVCRNTSTNDIVEADWTTFKAHMLDAIQPYLGSAAIRRLAMPKIVKELL